MGVARIMEKYMHKLFREGTGSLNGVNGTKPPEAHGLYNRTGPLLNL